MSDPLARGTDSAGDGTHFAPPRDIESPRRRGHRPIAETSKLARPGGARAHSEQRLILNLLEIREMTTDEVAVTLCKPQHTVSPRMTHMNAAGEIDRTGATRPTRSGKAASVWRVIAAVGGSTS